MINKLFHNIFLTCEQATLLIEQKQGQQLSHIQNIQLKTHLHFCKNCHNYNIKATKLDSYLSNLDTIYLKNNEKALIDIKNSIKAKIQEKN